MSAGARHSYWLRTRRLTLALLAFWLALNLGVAWFARDFDAGRRGAHAGVWWLVAQGTLLAYLAIVVVYAVAMDRLDAECLRDDEPPGDAARTDGAAGPV